MYFDKNSQNIKLSEFSV